MNVLIIKIVNLVYSIKIKLMKNIFVEKVSLVAILSKTDKIIQWNVWIMKHVKIMMEMIKHTLICQKKSA